MPTISGQEYQHAMLKPIGLSLAGPMPLSTHQKVSFKTSTPKKEVLDYQGQYIGFTMDNTKHEGSISMLLSEWRNSFRPWLVQSGIALAAAQGSPVPYGPGQVSIDLSLVYGNSAFNYMEDQLFGVMFNEDGVDSQNNQDALAIEIPLFIMKIVPNGQPFVNFQP